MVVRCHSFYCGIDYFCLCCPFISIGRDGHAEINVSGGIYNIFYELVISFVVVMVFVGFFYNYIA